MKTGILLTNLGSPDAPTTPAVRRYLRQFLSDPRVIHMPQWKWQIILNLFVLTTRPAKSAAAYREVWTDEGSPLLATARAQCAKIAARFEDPVALGMRYGNPSIESAVAELRSKGCKNFLLLPLYPQFSHTTTSSTLDVVPADTDVIRDYHDDSGYIDALANSVRETWADGSVPEKLLMSFHGIPVRYVTEGNDPYPDQCAATAKLLAAALELRADQWQLCFQSRFGKEPWLEPYTDATLTRWAAEGIKSVDVICPGFSADCLETLEEIDVENRGYFEGGGGEQFRYIPALNDRDDHIEALENLLARRGMRRS